MDRSLPRIAYVLLWFPKPSETFIFREIVHLWAKGVPIKVFTLYGRLTRSLSPEMSAVNDRAERMGLRALVRMCRAVHYWWKRNPTATAWLFGTVPLRRWRNFEVGGENLWAFFAGFHLAGRCEDEGIQLIHAPWANGPATAAWVASKLTGIPFSFSGRAHDICPPCSTLAEKLAECRFAVTNNAKNVELMRLFAGDHAEKIHLAYNGYTMTDFKDAPVPMTPPYRIVTLGRFAPYKGFHILLRAAKALDDLGLDFHLTIAGSGAQGPRLKFLAWRLGLRNRVSFPGFIAHEKVSELFASADLFVMPCIVDPSSGNRDGIPNVIMEALLHRVPVIATHVSALGEVVIDGETGVIVGPGDVWDLAQAVYHLTQDRDRAIRLAENGRTHVLEQFNPDRNYEKILKLFREHAKPADEVGCRRTCSGCQE